MDESRRDGFRVWLAVAIAIAAGVVAAILLVLTGALAPTPVTVVLVAGNAVLAVWSIVQARRYARPPSG